MDANKYITEVIMYKAGLGLWYSQGGYLWADDGFGELVMVTGSALANMGAYISQSLGY